MGVRQAQHRVYVDNAVRFGKFAEENAAHGSRNDKRACNFDIFSHKQFLGKECCLRGYCNTLSEEMQRADARGTLSSTKTIFDFFKNQHRSASYVVTVDSSVRGIEKEIKMIHIEDFLICGFQFGFLFFGLGSAVAFSNAATTALENSPLSMSST